jgi:uncharacterized membrane protein
MPGFVWAAQALLCDSQGRRKWQGRRRPNAGLSQPSQALARLWYVLALSLSFSALCLALNTLYIQALAAGLPERVATHFGFDGRPDGWMSRAGFTRFAVAFPVAIALFVLGLGYCARYTDPNSLHVANAAYWRSSEHYVQACDRLLAALGVLVGGLTVFLAFVWHVMARAQTQEPVRIDKSALIVAALPFAVFVAGWCIWLGRLYDLPK